LKAGRIRKITTPHKAEPGIIKKMSENRKEPPLHKRKTAKQGGEDE